MKILQTVWNIDLNQAMDISVDVHKNTLTFFLEAGNKDYADACSNRWNIDLNQAMDISVDVHKNTLTFFLEAGNKDYADACSNRTTIIIGKLEACQRIALARGMKTLRVICEPGGEYRKKLLGHADASTTMIYMHVLNRRGISVISPADF